MSWQDEAAELRREFAMRRQSACAVFAPAPQAPQVFGAARGLHLAWEVADLRSDGGSRRIDILDHDVQIERSVAGVKMRLAIPFTLFEGVALDILPSDAEGGLRFLVRLLHEDKDLEVLLYEAEDDRDITAAWQFWAGRLGLPLLMSDGEGGYREPFPRLGPMIVGRPRPRRVPAHLAKRRPRFLVRRRTGRLADAAMVHSGREIIAPY
jgi:hypothetical protein